MAGGKETPRQKLIGLMYLVLLAMLALQVSSAIIQKFQFLNSSLENALDIARGRNSQVVENIKKAVKDNGNRAGDIAVLKHAEEVQQKSDVMIKRLSEIKQELIMATADGSPDGKDENGQYKGAKDEDKVANIMVGDKSTNAPGKAYALQKELNDFSAYLFSIKDSKGIPLLVAKSENEKLLAPNGDQDPITKGDPEQKGKDFAEINFAHTPMIACLAVLTDKQNRIAAMESDLLNKISSEVGAQDIKFDKIKAMFRANSKVVAAGMNYEAEMFIAAQSSALKPTMTYAGRPIEVKDGVGQVKFKASATTFDAEGLSKQKWSGTIKLPIPGRGDTTFKLEAEYMVAKPVIEVASASVNALYYECCNELKIKVPALGANYKPSFSSTGASVERTADIQTGIFTPNSMNKTKINVSNDGAALGSVEFDVKELPIPRIEILVGGSPVNPKKGYSTSLQGAQIKVLADPSVAETMKKDCRYLVSGELSVKSGSKIRQNVKFSSTDASNLTYNAYFNQLGDIRETDMVIVEVMSLTRVNCRGKSLPIKQFRPVSTTIGFQTK